MLKRFWRVFETDLAGRRRVQLCNRCRNCFWYHPGIGRGLRRVWAPLGHMGKALDDLDNGFERFNHGFNKSTWVRKLSQLRVSSSMNWRGCTIEAFEVSYPLVEEWPDFILSIYANTCSLCLPSKSTIPPLHRARRTRVRSNFCRTARKLVGSSGIARAPPSEVPGIIWTI